MPVILADRYIPYLEVLIQKGLHIIPLSPEEITRAKILENEAEGLLIRTRTLVNQKLLEGTPIHFIGTATIGTDHIDTGWCKSQGIEVVSAPGCNAGGVMQYIAAALAQYFTRIETEAAGLTLGIVGYGNTGKLSAKVGKALGMKVLINDPPMAAEGLIENHTPLEQLLCEADIVTLHVPYNQQGPYPTHYLINGENIKHMKTKSLLINTSRGGVVEEKALLKFKAEHSGFNFILDVWENEPNLNTEVLEKAFLSTPHIAGYSLDGKRNASQVIFTALIKHFGLQGDISLPEIPPPLEPVIKAQHLLDAILKAYQITQDDIQLRRNPNDFEKLRSNYPFRHEFPHYTINGLPVEAEESATLLGFGLVY